MNTISIQDLTFPERQRALSLPDGRAFAWSEWGPPTGIPILFCTGAAMSGSLGFASATVHNLGLRLISFDRPGLGRSTLNPEKSLTSWVRDVRHVLPALTRECPGHPCLAVGFSQGAPYALAFAAAQLVSVVAIVSGQDDFSDPAIRSMLPAPVADFVSRVQAAEQPFLDDFSTHATADGMLSLILATSSDHDLRVYTQQSFQKHFLDCLREGFSQGPVGYVQDLRNSYGPWPFRLRSIGARVALWYGRKDASAVHSPDFGRALATKLGRAEHHLLEEGGGSLLWTHADEILRDLVTRGS